MGDKFSKVKRMGGIFWRDFSGFWMGRAGWGALRRRGDGRWVIASSILGAEQGGYGRGSLRGFFIKRLGACRRAGASGIAAGAGVAFCFRWFGRPSVAPAQSGVHCSA